MWFADFALRRSYTIIASLIVVCLGLGAGLRMPFWNSIFRYSGRLSGG